VISALFGWTVPAGLEAGLVASAASGPPTVPTCQMLKLQPALAGASQPNGLKVKKRKIKILI